MNYENKKRQQRPHFMSFFLICTFYSIIYLLPSVSTSLFLCDSDLFFYRVLNDVDLQLYRCKGSPQLDTCTYW